MKIKDLNLSENYKKYFLKCYLYLFSLKLNDYTTEFVIYELIEMTLKDKAFEYSLIFFASSLCNNFIP